MRLISFDYSIEKGNYTLDTHTHWCSSDSLWNSIRNKRKETPKLEKLIRDALTINILVRLIILTCGTNEFVSALVYHENVQNIGE